MDKTHFGYQEIPTEEKEKRVGSIFTTIATKYDLMNTLMSGGIHYQWKREMLRHLNGNGSLLDVAGGTGDIARMYYQKHQHSAVKPRIVLCDINETMVREGRDHTINKNMLHALDFVCGNGESLPFPDQSFDYYTIAFGIRNVTHINQCLTEAYRVLKPGGKFVCLEFSHVINPVLQPLYHWYSFAVIPKLGKLIAGNEEAYQYLVESIRKFPTQTVFADMIKAAGFSQVAYTNLTQGITAIHYGWRL